MTSIVLSHCRPGGQRVVDREHEFLAVFDVRGRVVVIGLEADGVEVAEVRVDPGDRRERALGGVLEEAGRLGVDPDLKRGFPLQVFLAEKREAVVVSEGVAVECSGSVPPRRLLLCTRSSSERAAQSAQLNARRAKARPAR
jgi:hypothetical protein